MSSLEKITLKFVQETIKLAGRSKHKPLNRKNLLTSFDKSKAQYQKLRLQLSGLEKEKNELERHIDEVRSYLQAAKKSMLDTNRMISTMDLSGANKVNIYENEDVGYVIDNQEHHVEVDGHGEITCVLLKEHRKGKKKKDEEPTEGEVKDENNVESEIDAEADATAIEEELNFPNLRFLD